MARSLRFLVAESELPAAREERRASVGQSSGETYQDTLRRLAPDASCDRVTPADKGSTLPDAADLDAVFLTGSPLHLYERTPEVSRQLDFMRGVFAAGGRLRLLCRASGRDCGGRPNTRGREAAFAGAESREALDAHAGSLRSSPASRSAATLPGSSGSTRR
jgi:GMP synthase (glutamine-hydrolysing)